jgi:hypothetical protein
VSSSAQATTGAQGETGMIARANQIGLAALIGAFVMALSALFVVPTAQADYIAERVKNAGNLLRSGEPNAAFEALDSAVNSFWTIAPLTIHQAYFVSQGTGGDRLARPANEPFSSGETVTIHVEPLGYGFSRDGEDFQIVMTTGIEIRTFGQLILAKSADFGRFEWSGQAKNRNFAGRVSIDLPDLKPGDYEILLTLNDQASQKKASIALPLTVAIE